MKKTFGMNRHQKAARRPGEPRVGREQIEELLALSTSVDAEDRLEAARLLCPCHVRRRIESVWQALYRLLEDPDPHVRWAAWHTLEDGGAPSDPAIQDAIERALRSETDLKVLRMVREVAGRRETIAVPPPIGWRASRRGRCDFCAGDRLPVDRDLQTMIPGSAGNRPALICESCYRRSS